MKVFKANTRDMALAALIMFAVVAMWSVAAPVDGPDNGWRSAMLAKINICANYFAPALD